MFKIINVILLLVVTVSAKFNLCIETSQKPSCDALATAKPGEIECVADTRSNCFHKVLQGEVDGGYFSATELLMLNQFGMNLSVVASLRPESRKSDAFDEETVAIVHSSYNGKLAGLNGGVYCHEGIRDAGSWPTLFFKAFERKVVEMTKCSDDKTADQLETQALENFFGSGCRPVRWSVNNDRHEKLKNNSKLCSLCKYNCATHQSTEAFPALECLKTNINNTYNKVVAYVAWSKVKEYFTPANWDSFSMLCPDGSVQILTSKPSSSPCSFVKQPWAAFASKTEKSADIVKTLNSLNTGQQKFEMDLIIVEAKVPNITTYINPMPEITKDSCMQEHRWCVSSLDKDKCTWIKQAASALGIKPAIACVTSTTCLDEIQNNKADFVILKDQFLNAVNNYHLNPVMVVKKKKPIERRIVAVSKTLTNMTNVKISRACFPQHNDLATCAYSTRYVGDDGALKCLVNENADVAFVDLMKITVPVENVIILCRNYAPKFVATLTPGLTVDDKCLLDSVSNDSVVFAKSNMTRSTSELLSYLDFYFGNSIATPFELNADIKNMTDLIFEDSDTVLSSYDDSSTSNIEFFINQAVLPTCPVLPNDQSPRPKTTKAPDAIKGASHSEYSFLTLIVLTFLSRFF